MKYCWKYFNCQKLDCVKKLSISNFSVIQRKEIRLNALFHSSKVAKTSIMKILEIRYQICSGIGEDFSAMLCRNTHTYIISDTESYSFSATSCNNNLLKKRIGTLRNIHYSNGKKFESFCIQRCENVCRRFIHVYSLCQCFLLNHSGHFREYGNSPLWNDGKTIQKVQLSLFQCFIHYIKKNMMEYEN